MNLNLARRLMKLGSPAEGSCFDFIRLVMANTDNLIRARGSNIPEHAAPHYAKHKRLNPFLVSWCHLRYRGAFIGIDRDQGYL